MFYNLGPALSNLSQMIAKLEMTLFKYYITRQGPDTKTSQTMEASINNKSTTTESPP